MSGSDLSHIEAIIWDLDNTLYRYSELFVTACNHAAARTAIDLGLVMDFDEAVAMATECEKLWGNSFKFFGERGINYRDFHLPYHDSVDLTVIEKNEEMKRALESLDLPMVILTNASRSWAARVLDHLDYTHLFPSQNIIALEDNNFEAKAYHDTGFRKGLSIVQRTAANTLMVEDLPRNLPKAKELGLVTALVHHGKIPDDHRAHVDYEFATTLDLVAALK